MADPITIPGAGESLTTSPSREGDDRRPNASWYRFWQRVKESLNAASGDVTGKAAKEQPWSESTLIEVAADKDYRFVDQAFGWTITSVVTRSQIGTCTLTVKINSTALGGTANSVSTTEQTQTHSSANVVAPGDDIVLTVSSNADAEGVSVTLKGTRTLS